MRIFAVPFFIAIALSVGAAMMAACTTDTYYADDFRNYDSEFGREDANPDTGEEYATDTVRSLEGGFNLASFLEPVKLEISSLDRNLEKQESVTARIERNRIEFTYKVKEIFFTEPFVAFDLTCRFRDSKDTTEMQFRSIGKLSDKGARNIKLYGFLESEYLKKLMQKEGESFDLARKHTRKAIHDLLDPEVEFKYGIVNAPYGSDTLETFAYLYGLFFMKDTTFYKNFQKLSKAIGGEKRWDEVLSRKKISDKLIEHYKLGQSQCDSTIRNELKKDVDWTQLRYNMARKIVGDTLTCTDTASSRDTVDVPDTTTNDTAKTDTLPEVSLAEIFGECSLNRQNQKAMLDTGKYYQCKDREWVPIMAPAYYEDYGEEGDIITHDGEYFICNGGYRWNAVPEEFVVPPVRDLQPCIMRNIAQYGDKVYRCDRYFRDGEYIGIFWYEFPEDSIPAVQRNGLFCTDSTTGRIEDVNGTYWICKYSPATAGDYGYFIWSKLAYIDSVLYAFSREHQGDCKNGRTGTTVYWNEDLSTHYSSHLYLLCDDTYHDWGYDYTGIGAREDYEPAVLDGGIFVNDSTFVAQHGEFTYTVMKRKGWAWIFDIVNITADIDGREYGAFFKNQVPYLSGRRGEGNISADSFPGKSESFDSFVTPYTHPESAFPAFNILLMHAGENSYMDWLQAAAFCPEGYHVPDTSEWSADFLKNFTLDGRDTQDSPMQIYHNGKRNLYDIYWTATPKDSETHYCYEIRSESGNQASRITECPDDLYPGVQTLCFKDREEE